MNNQSPVVLLILDGFGIWREEKGNAILAAKTPNLQKLTRNYPGVALQSSGIEVGLSWGEMGNSEVGHINIGAGQMVYQNFVKIQFAIQDGSFFNLPIWEKIIKHAEKNQSAIHLAGLISNGGIHSHIEHLFALLKMLSGKKIKNKIFIHCFTDGRDASPQTAPIFLKELRKQMHYYGLGEIASLSGRYYSMDRNKRWERTELAYKAMVGEGETSPIPEKTVENAYSQNITDEFIKPAVIVNAEGKPIGSVQKNDALIFFNFRSDRMRQLTELFLKSKIKNLMTVSMTEYNKEFDIPVAFPSQPIEIPLAKAVSNIGKKQLHIAETEKYPHITYFLNGGEEKPFKNEDRVFIPSPKVLSYDKKPEMSVYEITEKAVEAIENQKYDLIAINFANGDMVGHTGNFEATVKAIETMDECIGKIHASLEKYKGSLIITADHGNCEEMINLATGKADTEHSTNPIPCWVITPFNKLKEPSNDSAALIVPSGILADVAPTVLELMNIPQPKQMTGRSLLNETNPLVLK